MCSPYCTSSDSLLSNHFRLLHLNKASRLSSQPHFTGAASHCHVKLKMFLEKRVWWSYGIPTSIEIDWAKGGTKNPAVMQLVGTVR